MRAPRAAHGIDAAHAGERDVPATPALAKKIRLVFSRDCDEVL
jgi:hypothetical protein